MEIISKISLLLAGVIASYLVYKILCSLFPIHRKYFYVSFTGYSKGVLTSGSATVMSNSKYLPVKELVDKCEESFSFVVLNCISEISKNQYDEFNN